MFNPLSSIAPLVLTLLIPQAAHASCRAGIYGQVDGGFVVLGNPSADRGAGQRYIYLDGRRGRTGEPGSSVECTDDVALVRQDNGSLARWTRVATTETYTNFSSRGTRLAGQLVEPPDAGPRAHPLVVLVHGSEKAAAIGSIYGYLLAAQGVSAFVYDKRGTGASEGIYTQNFELLADDAVAALARARSMAAGRFIRAGFFGGSQGGWVAPLAAIRAKVDFVAVGFGLIASPIDEDREEMMLEAEAAGLGPKERRQIAKLSDATAALVRSHFTLGYDALARVKREIGDASWAQMIEGEYSGAMLRMDEADLRRVGRAVYDNVELIWDYDSLATLRKLDAPLLWILAGEDREAPIANTRKELLGLAAAGKPIDVYMYPNTDHGMVEFKTNGDGSRTTTRITEGYLRLLADWIKGDVEGLYGRAEHLR